MTTAVQTIRTGLSDLGYTDDLVEASVRVAATDGPRLDLVAYSSPDIKDISTTAIAGHVADADGDRGIPVALDMARQVAAPGALIALRSRLKLFSVAVSEDADQFVAEFATDNLEALRRFRPDLEPRALSKAKRSARQLGLFPIDVRLLANARENSADRLSALMEDAIDATRPHERAGSTRSIGTLIAAVALLVVRDRYELPGTTAQQIADAAMRRDATFEWLQALTAERPAIDVAIDALTGSANFGWLDGAVISRLYENLLVTKSARKTYAIHYTPQELANRIAATLPFEAIPPDERSVLDPTCGSGSLLAASHSRLADLATPSVTGLRSHELLKASIRGWDIDSVATEIARLTLVVQSLPYGNHWAIEERDALKRTSSEDRARVVVSNPPWMVKRGKREDVAERFLLRMQSLVEPGGFLACVLPAAWLLREKSSSSRSALTEAFDVVEVWRLPRDVFAQARHSSCVVIAQRKTRVSRSHYLFRQIAPGRERIRTFLRTGEAAFNALGTREHAAGGLIVTPFDALPHFSSLPLLGQEASVVSGVVQRANITESPRGIPILKRGVELSPGGAVPKEAIGFINNIDDFSPGRRNVEPFANKKVLLQALRFPDNAWRARPLLDEVGLVTSETWNGVFPKRNTKERRTALMAFFMSSFASAWFYTKVATRRLHVDTIRDLPLPTGGLDAITQALSEIGAAWFATSDRHLLPEIDAEVANLYQLPAWVQRAVKGLLANQTAPEGSVRYVVDNAVNEIFTPDPTIHRPGTVLKIEKSRLWIWTPEGPNEGQPVDVPARIPGWLCEEGATFEIVGKDLSSADYNFQRSTHMSDRELFGLTVDG